MSRVSSAARFLRVAPFSALALAFVLGSAAVPLPAGATDKVLLVSWDGVGRRAIRRLVQWQDIDEAPRACPNRRHAPRFPVACGGYLTCLPTLCGFQIIDSWDSEGKPLTRPQHAQMLSGYSPKTTGVSRNNGLSRLPEGLSIYERLRAALGPALKTVHVAGPKYVSRGVVRYAQRSGAIDYLGRRGGPDRRSGANTTARFVPMLEAAAIGPFFAFVHYKEADVTGHESGADNDAYHEAIVLMDEQLAQLIATLGRVRVAEDTLVLVTTDHGFDGRFHVAREPQILETWIAARNGSLRTDVAAKLLDVTPTVLDAFGVDVSGIAPPLEGTSLLEIVDR